MTTAVLDRKNAKGEIKLPTPNFRFAADAVNHWHGRAEDTHKIDDVMQPGYLWHVHARMKPLDEVVISHPRALFYVRLLVIKIERETQSVLTRPIMVFDWSEEPVAKPDLSEARVERAGADGWRVVNGHAVLVKGFETKAEAQEWLAKRLSGTER